MGRIGVATAANLAESQVSLPTLAETPTLGVLPVPSSSVLWDNVIQALKEAKKKANELDQENRRLADKNATLIREVKNHVEAKAAWAVEKERLQSRCNTLSDKGVTLEREKADVESKLGAILASLKADNSRIRKEREAFRVELVAAKEEVVQEKKKVDALSADNDNLTAECERASAANKELSGQYIGLKGKYDLLVADYRLWRDRACTFMKNFVQSSAFTTIKDAAAYPFYDMGIRRGIRVLQSMLAKDEYKDLPSHPDFEKVCLDEEANFEDPEEKAGPLPDEVKKELEEACKEIYVRPPTPEYAQPLP